MPVLPRRDRPTATGAVPVADARRWADSIAPTPSSAPATSASPRTPRIWRSHWSRSTPSSSPATPPATAASPSRSSSASPGPPPTRSTTCGPASSSSASRCRPGRSSAGRATSRSATGSPTSSRSPRPRWHSTSQAAPSGRLGWPSAEWPPCHGGCPQSNGPLIGRAAGPDLWRAAAAHAADGAKPLSDNAFKVDLVQRVVARQLATVAESAVTYPQRLTTPAVGAPLARVDGPLKVTGHGALRRRQSGARLRPRRAGVQHRRHGLRGPHRHHHGRDELRECCACSPTSPHVTLPYDIRRVAFFGQPVAVVVADDPRGRHTRLPTLVEVRYTAGCPADGHRCTAGDPEARPQPRLLAR